jgi:RNA recognition motif-containing protein
MDIFVGSLSFKITESKLREAFEKYGEVKSVTLVIDKATRLKKGYGFVEMENDEQALTAIEALNGTELLDRTIVVNKAVPKEKQDKTNRRETPQTYRREFDKKKPKERYVTFGDDNRSSPGDKGFKTRKKPQNFKVGKKRKS